MTNPGGPAAGWYPDPATPGGLRWWDGRGWSDHTAVAAGVPVTADAPVAAAVPVAPAVPVPVAAGVPPLVEPVRQAQPHIELGEEQAAARWAATGLIAGAIGYAVNYLVAAAIYHYVFTTFLDRVREASDASANGATPATFPSLSGWLVAGNLVNQVAGLGLLVAAVLFMVWMYRAARVAAHLGLPARHGPGWAAGGFIVPIVNLWFPYQSACDLFPPGHPHRKLVGRWWALWLTMSFFGVVIAISAFVFWPLAVVAALVGIGIIVAAAKAARDVIVAVGAVHAELIAAVTAR